MAVSEWDNGPREGNQEEFVDGIFDEEEGALDGLDEGMPPLLQSLLLEGNIDGLRDALDSPDCNIDDRIVHGETFLHLCCAFGRLSGVQLLLDRGANPEVKDEEGALPLHEACLLGFTEIVQLLCTFGSSESINRMVNTADVHGDTPLHLAARGRHLPVVKLLLSAGACPSTRNISGQTPAELTDPNSEVRQYLETVVTISNSDHNQ